MYLTLTPPIKKGFSARIHHRDRLELRLDLCNTTMAATRRIGSVLLISKRDGIELYYGDRQLLGLDVLVLVVGHCCGYELY